MGSQKCGDEFYGIGHVDGHAIARMHAYELKKPCDGVDFEQHPLEGDFAIAHEVGDTFGPFARVMFEYFVESIKLVIEHHQNL